MHASDCYTEERQRQWQGTARFQIRLTCVGGLQTPCGHKLALGQLHDILLAVNPDDYVGPALLHDIPSHLEAVLQVLLPFLRHTAASDICRTLGMTNHDLNHGQLSSRGASKH